MSPSGRRRAGQAALLGRLAVALVAGSLALPAQAADEGTVLRLRAEQLVEEGRCQEVEPLLRRLRRAGPYDADASFLAGICAIRERRYADAVPALEQVRTLAPERDEALVYLGIAHYQLGDTAAAEKVLAEATRRRPRDAEAQLFYGLALLQRAKAAEAAAALEQAHSLDPGRVDPAASYFAGRAWQLAEDRERAEQALARVEEVAPDSAWALEAERALASQRSRYQPLRPWARFTAGLEYDSNVLLRGEGVILPPGIPAGSGQQDGRAAWYLRGGAELLRGERWALGAVAGYYGSAHFQLGDFDTHYPSVGGYVDYLVGESTYLRFQPDFSYAWVDYDDFLLTPGFTASLHHDYEEAGIGRAWFRFEYRDYLFLTNPTNNRDGFNYFGGYDHAFFVTDTTELRGSVGGQFYDAVLPGYRFAAPVVRAGGTQQLPLQSTFDVDFLYKHEFYTGPIVGLSTPPGNPGQRDDDLFLLAAVVEKRFTKRLLGSIRYRFQRNLSPVDQFDFERHIVGAFVTVELGPSTERGFDLGRLVP